MGYVYNCDACGDRRDEFPPLAGEFNERFLKTTGGDVAERFSPGETVTICGDCARRLVL